MSDLWEWYNHKLAEFHQADDQERIDMVELSQQGFDMSETDPQGMAHIYRQARDTAKRLDEPWFTFYYDVWLAIAFEAHVRDLQAGLTQSLHAVNESRKPILKGHPWIIAAYNTLLSCYIQIDPIGYAPAIRECLRHLRKEIAPGPSEHRYVMMKHQCDFYMVQGKLKFAEQTALAHEALFDKDPWGNEWYLLYPIMDMCWIGWQRNDWRMVQEYGVQGEELATRLENTQLDVVEAQLWQALAARKADDEQTAQRMFRGAQARLERLEKEPSPELYDAWAGFYIAGEGLDKALYVRDRQLERISGKGRYGYECDVLIQRCELLARLNRLTPADLEAAAAATVPLKTPKKYQQRIKALGK